MSTVDLKGNTNFILVKNTDGEYVVPRTNLAAIDMTTANGIHAANNVLSLDLADPLQLTTGADGNGVVNATVFGTALKFARNSVFDIDAQSTTYSGVGVKVTEENGEHRVTANPQEVGAAPIIGLTLNGPLPVVSDTAGKYLVVVDVKTEDIPADSITISSDGTQIPVANYDTTSTTTNVWTRLAFVLDTSSEYYTGDIKLTAVFPDGTGETSLVYKNLYIASVIDLIPGYIEELASVIGTPDAYLIKPGYGVDMTGGTININLPAASVEELINNTDDNMLRTKNFTGALTAGKAVDVTNAVNVSVGTVTRGLSSKDPVTWSGVTGGTIGFYDDSTKFPAYADGLEYLLLAKIVNNGAANVVVAGTNAVNGTLPATITPGSTVSVAKTFTTATDGYLTASSTAEMNLYFQYIRESEVTGCSDEARSYIASLPDPDNTDDYYLIDEDTVNPWLTMIDMDKSTYTLVQPGLAYKLFANTGAEHTIAVPTIRANKYGRPAYMELFVGNGSNIKLAPPLSLAQNNNFTDNTLNNCSIRFMDGLATLTVDSVESSYIVNLTGGTYTTESGTLAYGLADSDANIIIFNSSVDGQELGLYGSTVGTRSGSGLTVLGNGITNTIITGTGAFGSAFTTTIKAVKLKDATLSGASISLSGENAIDGKLTNNGAISVLDGSTLIVIGAGTNSTAMDGTGSITFKTGTSVIDASLNNTGSIVLGDTSGTSTIAVDSNATVSFVGLNGYTTTKNTSATGHYLLANGSICSDIYKVTSTASTGANTLYYGLFTNTTAPIAFSDSTDGTVISMAGGTQSVTHSIVGNGPDRTYLSLSSTLMNGGKGLHFYNLSITTDNCLFCYSSSTGITIANCSFHDTTLTTDHFMALWGVPANVISCKFENIDLGNSWSAVIYVPNGGTISNCVFKNCDASNINCYYAGSIAYVNNCLFDCPDNTKDALIGTGDGKYYVSGSTFTNYEDRIYFLNSNATVRFIGNNIFNGCVTGGGILEFAENSITVSNTKTATVEIGTRKCIDIGTNNIVIDGFTFKGGSGTYGGAILIGNLNNQKYTFKNCTFTQNVGGDSVIRLGSGSGGNSQELNIIDCVLDSTNKSGTTTPYTTGITGYANNAHVNISGSTIMGEISGADIYYYVKDSTIGILGCGGGRAKNIAIENVKCLERMTTHSSNDAQPTAFRIVKESYNTFSTTSWDNVAHCYFGFMSVGSYMEDVPDQWIVGGTASVAVSGSEDPVILSGIGKYITKSGDTYGFAEPYKVTETTGVGSGSLYAGLTSDAAIKYLTVDYDLANVSAVLGENDAVTAQTIAFMCADGRAIFNGDLSITAGSTVSVAVAKNPSNNVTIPWSSTVSITGGSLTIAGSTSAISGTVLVDNNVTVTEGSLLQGGSGNVFKSSTSNVVRATGRGNYRGVNFKGVQPREAYNIYNCTLDYTGYTIGSNFAAIYYHDGAATTNYITKVTINAAGLSYAVQTDYGKSVIIDSCNLYSGTWGFNQSWGGTSIIKNSLITSKILADAGSNLVIKGSTIDGNLYMGRYTNNYIFDGTDLITGRTVDDSSTTGNDNTNIRLIAGSTVSFVGNTASNDTPLAKRGNGTVSVGTYATPASYSGTWTTGGSATIITDGGTYSVSGTGTFIKNTLNPSGETAETRGTDLTLTAIA